MLGINPGKYALLVPPTNLYLYLTSQNQESGIVLFGDKCKDVFFIKNYYFVKRDLTKNDRIRSGSKDSAFFSFFFLQNDRCK